MRVVPRREEQTCNAVASVPEAQLLAVMTPNESEASVLLRYIVQEVNRDPGKYFKIAEEQRKGRGSAAGQEKHGLFILGSKAGAATRAAQEA